MPESMGYNNPNQAKGKNSNKGQGKAGGKINTPANIPTQMSGTKFGRPATINPHQSPKERKEAGLGGTQSGSNKSSYVY